MDARKRSGTLAAVLAVALATVGVADLAARSDAIAGWVDAYRLEQCRQKNCDYEYAGRFLNFEQRFLVEELPQADYSAGSVCFVGSSVMKGAIFLNDLNASEHRVIENYSWGAALHSQERSLVRYLVEDHGLLAAGGERTLVVVGLYYGSAAQLEPPRANFFKEMLTYEGLYTLGADEQMRDAPMSAIERDVRIERARLRQSVGNLLKRWDAGLTPATRPQTPAVFQSGWRDYMGSNWKANMRGQVSQLGDMVDYLRARGAVVAGVVLPLASWQRALPFPGELRSLVDPMFEAKHVPILDLSTLVDDADFGDSAHVTMRGERNVSDVLLGLARNHLRDRAILPACPRDTTPRPVARSEESGVTWMAPPGTKGMLVWPQGRVGAGEPLRILATAATAYRISRDAFAQPYVVEAFDAQGCSSTEASPELN